MHLPNPATRADWSAEITEEALGEVNGEISVLNPGETVEIPYDPGTDEGGDVVMATVLANRPARIQHLRSPVDASVADQWQTKRAIRFQIELRAGDPLILKGYIVKVVDGGKDKSLEQFAYTVTSAVNSSHAALRTIEAVSELAVVP